MKLCNEVLELLEIVDEEIVLIQKNLNTFFSMIERLDTKKVKESDLKKFIKEFNKLIFPLTGVWGRRQKEVDKILDGYTKRYDLFLIKVDKEKFKKARRYSDKEFKTEFGFV